jgi:streptogramin lyase
MRRTAGICLSLVVIASLLVLSTTPAYAGAHIDEFGTPSANSGPEGIALGPDGNIWYTECNLGNVGVMTPSRPPSFGNEFAVGGCPSVITDGPDVARPAQ